MEPYEVLTGGLPKTPETTMALVEALRRRRVLGELGAATGDRVMAPMGQDMVKQADAYAGDVQNIRQKDADNAQTATYQNGQLDHMDQTLAESIRAANQRDATTRRGQDLDLQAAGLRAAALGKGGKPARVRQNDITTLRQNATSSSTIGGMLGYLEKGGHLGAVGNLPVVGSILRQSLNKGASMGLGSAETKESAMHWQNYQRFYELAERNKLFGATLTPNEMAAWRQANPSSAQTDEQIKTGLKLMKKMYDHQQSSFKQGLIDEGYSPSAIAAYSNEMGQGEDGADQPAEGEDAGPTAPEVGEVVGGFIFNGGDPSDKKNWEKL